MKIRLNRKKLARAVAVREGGAINQSLAQIEETIRLTFVELQAESDSCILNTVRSAKVKPAER